MLPIIISFYLYMVYAIIFDMLVPTTCSSNCQCMAIKLKTKVCTVVVTVLGNKVTAHAT